MTTSPRVASLVADERCLHQRRLAGARRAHEEHEVALGDDEVDVLEGLVAVRSASHVVQHDDRMVRSGGRATAGEAVEQRRGRRGRARSSTVIGAAEGTTITGG